MSTVYIIPTDEGASVSALDAETGKTIGEVEVSPGQDPKDAAVALRRLVVKMRGEGTKVFWVQSPEEHTGVRRLLEQESAALEEAAASEYVEPSSEELRALNERVHLCRVCSHSYVCGIAAAIRQHDEALATIAGCLMFKPKDQEP